MTTIIRYVGLAIVAALILAGGPTVWAVVALGVALGLNVIPDVLLRRNRQRGDEG